MKTKMFETILEVVSEVTEVTPVDILSKCKDDDKLEARILFIWFCNLNGMHIPDIMKFLGRKSESSITDKIRDYHSWAATSTMFRLYAKRIASILPARIEEVAESGVSST